MSKEQFAMAMTFLGTAFNKPIDSNTVAVWYEFFQNIPEQTLKNAIKKIALTSKYLPSVQELMDMCGDVQENQINGILQIMWNDGYFKRGSYGELSDEQAYRNYDKAIMWVGKGIIPEWLAEDMKEYGYVSTPRIEKSNTKMIGMRSEDND